MTYNAKLDYTIRPAGNKGTPHYVIQDLEGTHHLNNMFFDCPEQALKYAEKRGVNISGSLYGFQGY